MDIVVIGIDFGKNSCSLAGLDASGRVVLRRRMRRSSLERYPGNPAIRRQAAIPDDWPSRSPLTTLFDGLFGRKDDVAPPSPSPDFFETPKPKPQVKRPKSEQPPAAPGQSEGGPYWLP